MEPREQIQVLDSLKIDVDFAQHFLEDEADRTRGLWEKMEKEMIIPDYSIPSVIPVIRWLSGKAKTLYVVSRGYDKRVISLILHSAYYLGESFVRSNKTLSWDTDTTAFPEVKGWKFGIRMSPIMESYEIFGNLLTEKKPTGIIEKKVLSWLIKT